MVKIDIVNNNTGKGNETARKVTDAEAKIIRDYAEKITKKLNIEKIKFMSKKYHWQGRQKIAMHCTATIGKKKFSVESSGWQMNLVIKDVLSKLNRTYEKRFKTQSGKWEN